MGLLFGTLLAVVASLSVFAADNAPSFDELLSRWNHTLQVTESTLEQSGLGHFQLDPLASNMKVVKESARKEMMDAQSRMDLQQSLMNALGNPPQEGEPAESGDIGSLRDQLGGLITLYDRQVKQSSLVIARANHLLHLIALRRVELLTRTLYERTPFPLIPERIVLAAGQFPDKFSASGQAIGHWLAHGEPEKPLLPAVSGVLAALLMTLLLAYGLSFSIHRRFGWNRSETHPSSSRKFTAMLAETVGQVVLPAALVLVFFQLVLPMLNLKPPDAPLQQEFMFILLEVIFLWGLSRVTLVSRYPSFRISSFTDTAANSLDRSIAMLVVATVLVSMIAIFLTSHYVSALDILVMDSVNASELDALVRFLSLLLIAVLLLQVLRKMNWRFSGDEGERGDTRGLPGVYRIVINVSRIAIAISILLVLTGYHEFGLFFLSRTALVLCLLALARVMHGFVVTLLQEATSSSNPVGAWFRGWLEMGDAGCEKFVFWVTLLFDLVVLVVIIIAGLLLIGVPWEEVRPVLIDLVEGRQIGNYTFSLARIALAVSVFVVLLLAVRLFQRFLSNRLQSQARVDVGVRDAVSSGIGYAGIVIAILVALSLLGLEFAQLAIIFGALSVGIGFGLQHVTNNFISGLVLLIQRPIKAGDWVVVGENQGYVKQINAITTEIETFDNASLIVPNSDLVSSQVINWMHKSKLGRVIIPVDVSYDSDPEQVRDILLSCAVENSDILRRPEPGVVFKDFGESALQFELRFYIRDMDYYWTAASGVRYAIKKKFNAAGIVIPYPQRDLHLRSGSLAQGEDPRDPVAPSG